jgi:pimeloyl-ACP methyl ester carboxylesterase
VQLGVKHLLTAGAGLLTALAPTVLVGTAAGLLISNAWAVAMDRAEKAGKVLAGLLMAGGAGERPVTIIAHGMGARLAFHCLLELARHGARGVIQDVVLLGAPVSRVPQRWSMARRVVAGRLINGYSKRDWLLSVLCWDGGLAAGLAAVEAGAVENVNLSGMVAGHLDYLDKAEEIVGVLGLDA